LRWFVLMTPNSFDVIVIGAGIIGLACAYELRRSNLSVCVLEQYSPGAGQSTKTGGGIRFSHSSKLNVMLTHMSLPVWRSFESLFGVDSRYQEIGHLFVTSDKKHQTNFEDQRQWHKEYDCPSVVLTTNEVKQKWPQLSNLNFVVGSYCAVGGYLDDHSVIQGYQNTIQKNGVKLYSGTRVEGLLQNAGQVVGVQTSMGEFRAETVINAAGAFAGEIASYASVSIPFCSRRHELLILNPAVPVPEDTPWLIDVDNQVHLRPDGQGRVLVGGFLGKNEETDPFHYSREYSKVWSDEVRAMASRSFGLTKLNSPIVDGWAGLYPGTRDYLPVIEKTMPGLITSAGFSGTGLMHAPAVGMIVSDLVNQSEFQKFDISQLSSSRFQLPMEISETSGF
jgi:sarcosine oxidase subunit beta